MDEDPSPTFGALLRRHRDDADLTQEELAERAGLTPEAIGLLERGERRRPQAYTVRKLGDGLGLAAGDRARFEAAARLGRAQPAPSPSAPRQRQALPEQPTLLIGREREAAAVATLLGEGGARLLTLTGPGGVGKTRLALHVATELATTYPHGVWLVELAALAEPALVAQTVAATLGVREEAGRPLVDTHVGDRRLLLVLDNCEHLVEACAALAAMLLRACPGARLLATSREGLTVAGETIYRVPSLAIPDPRRPSPPGDLLGYAAVRLFVDRAQMRRPDFTLALGNAGAVSRICARLDGIPLALELAAARVGALPVGDIADRLDDCVRMLSGGPRTALPRQQTLQASLDWSYGLLAAPEQALLRRLSVFAGGWTLEAAEAACAGEGIEEEDALTLLAQLVDKSLVHLEGADGNGNGNGNGDARYRLLEVVRQYARGKMRAGGEEDAARDRHAAWCVALARQAEPKLTGPEQAAWLERLEAENDNLRAALRWGLREGGGERGSAGVQLAGLLWRFWDIRGLLTEGRGWLRAALARDDAPAAIRGPVLTGAANLAWTQGDYQQAMDLSAQSVAMQRELGRTPALADALNSLGNVMRKVGEYARARALFEESLTVQREMGRTRGAAIAIGNLGLVALDQGDDERATGLLRESLALHRALGDRRIVAILLTNLGQLANWRGDHAQAVTLHQEGLALRRDIGDTRTIPISLSSLGGVAEARGDYRGARSLYEESLVLFLAMDDQEGIATCLEGMARSIAARALEAGDPPSPDDPSSPDNPPSPDEWERRDAMGALRQAARLFGAAAAVRERSAAPLPPRERAQHDRHAVSVRAALGDDVFGAAQADGRAMPREQVIAAVLERTLE